MLNIHFANRFETLAGLLALHIGAGSGSVFAEDQVIVPSAAVRRGLTLALAQRHGVCANVRFGYLARWLWQQVGRVVPGVADESPFDPSVLAWRVYAALDDGAWTLAHTRLAAYLECADPVSRFELATSLAGLFDQYITYRPDWLAAWSRGETVDDAGMQDAGARADQGWQAALWRRLIEEIGTGGLDPVAAFVRALADPEREIAFGSAALPATAHVFCLPAMPPLHLTMLQALAGRIEIHVYVLNPCREFWFEVVDRRRLAYLAVRGKDAEYHEEGQRLLAAWGRQTQSQLSLLVEAGGEAVIDDARFHANPGASLLARLQNSILELSDLVPGAVTLSEQDRSIEVHVCHSLTREIEVLHDRLLALFAAPDAPAPGEVLVATPDLDAAAPLIDAVFGTAPNERAIPYTITGRARGKVNPAARALLDVLALAGSRCTASAVFGLLQQAPVARRFGLAGDDLDRIRAWLEDSGVHWALDARHRASFGVPPEARHGFADGLDRLFLGYALPTRIATPFAGRLPAGEAEGSEALTLGALWHFIDALARLRRELAAPQPAAAWPGLLAAALDAFIGPQASEPEDLRELVAAVEALGSRFARSGLAQALPLEVVRAALAEGLDDPARGGVPTGMVTFAAMSSLRNIPFRVVCVIGLADGAFPTAARPPEFDLLALQPRRGDRQRRSDERNVFLDLLLAARERVHLSYVGRSVRDNSVLPPSVLVSELLEYLVPVIASDPADASALMAARARLVVEQPLQPFSEAAFKLTSDPRLRSFQREYADALKSRLATAGSPSQLATSGSTTAAIDDEEIADDDQAAEAATPFFARSLPEPGDEWRDVELGQLIRFFRNPCRYLLERRLGIALPRDDDALQDDEPFLPDVPGRSALAERLLPALLNGAGSEAVRALALAGTELPAGAFGRQFLERELAGLQDFAGRVTLATRAPAVAPHPVSVELELDGQAWRVHTAFADLRMDGLVRQRYDERRASDYLNAWLHHLMLCARPPPGVDATTTWVARDGQIRFKACDDPQGELRCLLRLYRRGLCEPLYFFPKTAWSYLENNQSLHAASQVWRVTKSRPYAESADAAYALALRGLPDPLEDGLAEFEACTHAVLAPLRACLDEALRP